MKTNLKSIFLLLFLVTILKANVNCAASVVAAVFIPLIGAVDWVDKSTLPSTDKHYFNFIVDTPNSNESKISGNETLNNVQFPFKGSFKNHDIEIIFSEAASARGTYKGTVNDASTEIRLTGTNNLPPLTLVKR